MKHETTGRRSSGGAEVINITSQRHTDAVDETRFVSGKVAQIKFEAERAASSAQPRRGPAREKYRAQTATRRRRPLPTQRPGGAADSHLLAWTLMHPG